MVIQTAVCLAVLLLKIHGPYSAIYPAPLTTWGKSTEMSKIFPGSSMNTLLNEVKNGHPVVAWVTINFNQSVEVEFWRCGE